MSEPRDPVLELLAALPCHDVDAWRSERLRRRAGEELEQRAARARKRWTRALGQTWRQVFEPALAAAVCASAFVWAISNILSVHGL